MKFSGSIRNLLMMAGFAALLAACTASEIYTPPNMRAETAKHLAMPSFMINRPIPANGYVITAYERVRRKGDPVTLYIEGDGDTLFGHDPSSFDEPAPNDPVALHIATRDLGPNVIWLARPCQYTQTLKDGKPSHDCPSKIWGSARYGVEAVTAMNTAIDDIKTRYNVPGFDLVGYAGGGAMALLIASGRNDILTIRTVGGILDTDLYAYMHKAAPLTDSANPTAIATKLANIPQNHFTGLGDFDAPAALYDSYRRAAGPSTCIRNTIIGKTEHEKGWVDKWPMLLKQPVDCKKFD
jgi:hypothetical protein